MNGKVLVALVLGLCLGFAVAVLIRQPQVIAAEAAPKWEYITVQIADAGGNANIGDHLKEVNKEGYEFVAMSGTGGRDYGCIAIFKRAKN
jgi:hypothetical protein